MTNILSRTIDVLWVLVLIFSLVGMYLRWQERGPLTGTPTQRFKCLFGFHDLRLFAFTTDPAWRLIWRCHRCAYEHLTPETHAKRVELDAWLPAVPERVATGETPL